MAKKFRLSKSFSSGSSHSLRRLSKAAKGKRVVGSIDIDFPMDRQLLSWDAERDLAFDDMGPEDFKADWVWPSRFARSRAAAEAKIRELFDPDYEPWEEVSGKGDHSDSENMDSEGVEFPNQSYGGSNLQNFHLRESSRSAAAMDVCETNGLSCLGVMPNDPGAVVSSGFAAKDSKVGCHVHAAVSGSSNRCDEFEAPGKYLLSGGGMKLRHRKKKVILGRDFLLVSRHCLQGSDKRFRFFHMPSHSAVEVKVKEPSLTANQLSRPDSQKSHKGCLDASEGDPLLVAVPDLHSPSRMEVVEEFPSSPSCVTVSHTPELSLEDSSSIKVGADLTNSASGPRNLRAKRIVASWRYRVVDCVGSTVRHSDSKKQKKINGIEGTDGRDKPTPPSLWRKRKRERVIEEDPHSYRAAQRRAFH